MRRFFIEKKYIDGNNALITGKDVNHLKNVLRLKQGEDVHVFDGTGIEYEAKIKNVAPDEIAIELVCEFSSNLASPVEVTIGQAFLKDKKMDTIVRHLTELGMVRWIPFMASRSIPSPNMKRLTQRKERWQKIVKESLKQCKLSYLPEIYDTVSYDELLTLSDDCDLKVFFWEEEVISLTSIKKTIEKTPKKIFIMLGPEGGFSEEEANAAKEKGFITASLGPRIMKADTASVAALTLIQFIFGDIGKNIS